MLSDVLGLFGGLVDGLLELAFPPKCVACGTFLHDGVDGGHGADRTPLAEAFCFPCGETLLPAETEKRAAWAFGGQLAVALERLKYGRQDWIARPLGRLWRTELPREVDLTLYDAVVPVPLHPSRQARRGFNQSALLAGALGVPVSAGALRRTRDTPPQVGLSREARSRNVVGAFQAGRGVAGRSLLVVDDVLTTGATLGECASVLRAAGVRRVDVLALAAAE